MPDWGFETRQIHSGGVPDPTTGARAVRLYPLPLQHELVRLIPGSGRSPSSTPPQGRTASSWRRARSDA
jgi:hypothetical protein